MRGRGQTPRYPVFCGTSRPKVFIFSHHQPPIPRCPVLAYQARFSLQWMNKDCRASIIFGHYLVSPETERDLAILRIVKPSRLKCSLCGHHTDYSQEEVIQIETRACNLVS